MNIHIVVPNYNGASNIKNLLKKVLEIPFSTITICDDASTDKSLEILKNYENKVNIIRGSKQRGPAGNRNRILKHIGTKGQIHPNDYIHFLDVDMEISNVNIAEIEKHFSENPKLGAIGGKILTLKNEQMWWNYGHGMHPVKSTIEGKLLEMALNNWTDKEIIQKIRKLAIHFTYNLEMSLGNDTSRDVDWVSEANFTIQAQLFKKIEGFDPKMKYHADQDLCKRIRDLGYSIRYVPSFISKHLEIDTFGQRRDSVNKKYMYYYYKKHYNLNKETIDYLLDI